MTPHISTTLLRTQSDERLVRLAAEGHERAFEAIVDRYRRPLTRFAQRFVGEARAEEVVQTAFLNAWSSLRSGTEVRDLKPWLYRIVNNGAINALQRAEYSDAPLIEASDFRMGPEASYEQSEELRQTVANISELPERQRDALLAVAVDGRAHADVARDLGVSDAGVRQLVRRARVQLRAAATAITPIPLAVWLADGGFFKLGASEAGQRTGEIGAAAGGTALGGAALGGALKAGALVVGVAAVATGGTEVVKKVEENSSSKAPTVAVASARPGERTLIPGADPTMTVGGGQAQVRIVTAPDGSQRVVVEAPNSTGTLTAPDGRGMNPAPIPVQTGPGQQPRQVAGVFSPTMPAAPSPGRGGQGGSGGSGSPSGPRQVAEVPGKPGSGSGSTGDSGSGRGDSGSSGSGSSGGPGSPSTTPSSPGGGSDKPSSKPSSPGEGSDKPSSKPSSPGGGSDKPSSTPSSPQKPADKPSASPGKPSSDDSGRGTPAGGRSDSGEGSSPGKAAPAPSPGKGGGKGKGGD